MIDNHFQSITHLIPKDVKNKWESMNTRTKQKFRYLKQKLFAEMVLSKIPIVYARSFMNITENSPTAFLLMKLAFSDQRDFYRNKINKREVVLNHKIIGYMKRLFLGELTVKQTMLKSLRVAIHNNSPKNIKIITHSYNYCYYTPSNNLKYLPFPSDLLTSLYHSSTQVNQLMLVNAIVEPEIYKSYADVIKVKTHLSKYIDLHLLSGFTATISHDEFDKINEDWVSPKNNIFVGQYESYFRKSCSDYLTQRGVKSKISDLDVFKKKWYQNLMSSGSVHVKGFSSISKTEYFRTKNINMIWQDMINRLYSNEIMISYSSQKNELGKTRQFANTNLLSHYIMTLVYTIIMEHTDIPRDSELYALLTPRQQSLLWNQIQTIQQQRIYCCNSIDQSKFDNNVRKYQIMQILDHMLIALPPEMNRIISLIRRSFEEQILITPSGRIFKYEDGLLSGWKCTSIFGSLINKIQCDALNMSLRNKGVIITYNFRMFMGDDVLVIGGTEEQNLLLLDEYNLSGLSVARDKTILSINDAEFLRHRITKDAVYGYPARVVPSIIFVKPWAKYTENKFSLTSWIENAATFIRRNTNLSTKMYSIYITAKITGLDFRKTLSVLCTPKFAGGYGIFPTLYNADNKKGRFYTVSLDYDTVVDEKKKKKIGLMPNPSTSYMDMVIGYQNRQMNEYEDSPVYLMLNKMLMQQSYESRTRERYKYKEIQYMPMKIKDNIKFDTRLQHKNINSLTSDYASKYVHGIPKDIFPGLYNSLYDKDNKENRRQYLADMMHINQRASLTLSRYINFSHSAWSMILSGTKPTLPTAIYDPQQTIAPSEDAWAQSIILLTGKHAGFKSMMNAYTYSYNRMKTLVDQYTIGAWNH